MESEAGFLSRPAKTLETVTKVGEYDIPSFLKVLASLSSSWSGRAAVKKDELDVSALYQDGLPDFLLDLLPFRQHPDFLRAPDTLKQRVLSCGWLAYNEKTIAIETKIISPACLHIIHGNVPGVDFETCKEVMAQAFVDEAYHTLLLVNACRVTRERRDLKHLQIPESSLISNMSLCQENEAELSRKILIALVCATVSEVSISDYLKLLSTAQGIQPLNMITTEIHRRDEAAHTGIFKSIGQMIYHALSHQDREFFLRMIPRSLAWFGSIELNLWQSMLEQIHFPKYEQIIADCRKEHEHDLTRRDFSALVEMADNLGIDSKSIMNI